MKQQFMFHFLFLLGTLLSIPAWTKTQGSVDLNVARQEFLRAEQSLKKADLETYQILKQRLQDYPLLPYLEYQEIRQKFNTLKPDDIHAALQKLSDTPLQYQLRRDWLNTLAAQDRWTTYLQFSTNGGTITQQCHRLNAMLKTGQQQQAFDAVEPIWLYGYSRP